MGQKKNSYIDPSSMENITGFNERNISLNTLRYDIENII